MGHTFQFLYVLRIFAENWAFVSHNVVTGNQILLFPRVDCVLLIFVFIHLLVCFICFCLSVCIVVGWRKDAAPLSPLNMITSAGGLGTCKNGRGVRRMATISCHASLSSEGLISNQHTDPQYLEGVFCPTWFPQADCRLSLEFMKSCLPRS